MESHQESETGESARKDTRADCKYGLKCYQKNPEHHKKFKHPLGHRTNPNNDNSKKRKNLQDMEEESEIAQSSKRQNVSSDSEASENDSNGNKNNVVPAVELSDNDDKADVKEDSNSDEKEVDSAGEESESTKKEGNSKENIEDEEINNENEDTASIINKAEEKGKSNDPYSNAKELILKAFLVNMPDDFYKFYDFCNELKSSDPSSAFKIAQIKLVGPYDVLNGLITKSTVEQYEFLIHWRYYYDPPEFQTILQGNDKEGLHFGYWRDNPDIDPDFVATNSCNVSHKIKPIAENIFGAVATYLDERIKKATPFEKTGISNLAGKLKAYAKKNKITLDTSTPKMKSRERNVVARTIHGAGIVCPYNKKTQLGYRELSVTDTQLLKIVKKIDEATDDDERAGPRSQLGEVVRLATIAGDECDFGTCLELGHDLLSTGSKHVQNAAVAVLSIAYNQLDRQAFLQIVEAHMKDRKKGCHLSVFENSTKA